MQFFLRLKHWQLFIISWGIPIVLEMVFFFSVVIHAVNSHDPNPRMIFNFFWIIPIVGIITMGSHFGWMWAVNTKLQKLIPQTLRSTNTTFKIFLIIPIFYFLFIFTWIFYFISHAIFSGDQPPTQLIVMFLLIIPIHLFSMFCIFYCLYFTAKTIKTAELQRPVTMNDYIGEFFLIWFFFIGVWILQPRINKLVTQENIPEN